MFDQNEVNALFQGFDIKIFEEAYKTKYSELPCYPTVGEHPRVFFTADEHERLISSLKAPENDIYLEDFERLVDTETTGELDRTLSLNIEDSKLKVVEAKAYKYVLTGEKSYGYTAIKACENTLLTASSSGMDLWRQISKVMELSACVYDWCYDLLTEEDKQIFIAAFLKRLAPCMTVGSPPRGIHGCISGHDLECQIFRGYLSFAIAVYDEAPFIYDYVAGRLFNEFVPAQNFFLSAGRHWESSMYGPFRLGYLLEAQILMSAMSHGKCSLFNYSDLERCANTFMSYYCDKNYEVVFKIGDHGVTKLIDYYGMSFWASVLFKDGRFKEFYTRRNFVEWGYNYLTSVRVLSLCDPDVRKKPLNEGRPLATALNYPSTTLLGRTKWESEDTAAFYMNMAEFIGGDHIHGEIGSFQIFYKGMLACDTGMYGENPHRDAYDLQAIASNTLLIYNHEYADKLNGTGDRFYSGGQSVVGHWQWLPYNIEQGKDPEYYRATVIGKELSADTESFEYAYLSGDMTKAYDDVTVDLVTRDMLAIATGCKKNPLVFVTFDRIDSKNADYKKTYLLHSKVMPEYDGEFVTVMNTKDENNGMLTVQSLHTKTNASFLGGNGDEYTINGKKYVPMRYDPQNPEYRTELTPKNPAKSDRLLTVLYVGDASENDLPIKARELETETLLGGEIFKKVFLFAKDNKPLSKNIVLTSDGSEKSYYIAGLKPGKWLAEVDGITKELTVTEDGRLLTLKASGKSIKLRPADK